MIFANAITGRSPSRLNSVLTSLMQFVRSLSVEESGKLPMSVRFKPAELRYLIDCRPLQFRASIQRLYTSNANNKMTTTCLSNRSHQQQEIGFIIYVVTREN